MASAAAAPIVSPYGLSPEELETTIRLMLEVVFEMSREEASAFAGYFFENMSVPDGESLTIPLNDLNTYKLCPKMVGCFNKSHKALVEAMQTSKDVKDHTKPGEHLNPAALFKQLIFWVTKGYHLHKHWSNTSEFRASVTSQMGETGKLEDLVAEIFWAALEEEAGKQEKNLSGVKCSVKFVHEDRGVITPTLVLERRAFGWTPVKDTWKPKKKPVNTKTSPAAAGGAAAGKAAAPPTVEDLATGEPPKPQVPQQRTWAIKAATAPVTPSPATPAAAGAAAKPSSSTKSATPAAGAGGGAKPSSSTKSATPAVGAAVAPFEIKEFTPEELENDPERQLRKEWVAMKQAEMAAAAAAPASAVAVQALTSDQLVIEVGAVAVDLLVKAFGFSPAVFATAEAGARAAVVAPLTISDIAAKAMEAMLKEYTTPTPAGSPITELFKISFKIGEAAVKLRRGH